MTFNEDIGCWRISTDQVIVPDWAQHPGGGLPEGDIRTGYTRTRREADAIARCDRRQGGKPSVERCGDTLPAIKRAATLAEKRRVFEDFNAPRDIRVEFDGEVHERRLWQSVGAFGWGKWTREA